MATLQDENYEQLVERLTTGFGAMLKQVQELACKNTELEQRLARVRAEEAQHLGRPNRTLSEIGSQCGPQEEQDGYQEPRHLHSCSEPGEEGTCMGQEDQETAVAIANGVEAWKILTDGKGPLWRRHNENKRHELQTQDSRADSPKQNQLHTGHPAVDQNNAAIAECPFAALSRIGEQETPRLKSPVMRRPDSLPTPPHTQEPFVDALGKDAYAKHDSPPPSVSGSISKCPIRMLDERSPEEIAQFFENHKHDIPRSHEICVRRYQSNSQTIRELDAKYGNLANMIKGLGVKHQSLLPSKEDDGDNDLAMDTNSMRKVESWAHSVKGADIPNDHLSESDDRQAHFDRPLKEIRVGESPSRPWGISVPPTVPLLNLGETFSIPTPKGPRTKTSDARARLLPGHSRKDGSADDASRMLFTGPVFIGYGPEQAAAFVKECGLKI